MTREEYAQRLRKCLREATDADLRAIVAWHSDHLALAAEEMANRECTRDRRTDTGGEN